MGISIETALYKKSDGTLEEVRIDTIENHSDFETVKRNLFCSFAGCPSRIDYVPKGKYKAYFRTWPKDDHSTDCLNYFEREKIKNSEKGSASINVPVSEKHVNDVLKRLIKEANQSEEERKSIKTKRKKVNKVINTSLKSNPGTNVNPTTDSADASPSDAKREPNIRKRHNIQLLDDNDLGFLRAVYGKVTSISIDEKQIILDMSSKNKRCLVHFEESFFAKAALNITSMFKNVERYIAEEGEVFLACVGLVQKRGDEFFIQVERQDDFRINSYKISVFSLKYVDGAL